MITSKHLGELLNFRTPMSKVVSLYLEVGPDRGYLDALRRALRAAQTQAAQGQCQEDLARLQGYIETEFEPGNCHGLAAFSSKRFGLWRVCPLPEPVKTSLFVGRAPYLAPLLSMTDQRHRFGAVLASMRSARFMEVFMGQITEYQELAVKAEDCADGHAFLKKISEKLDGLARNQGFQRIVVGVSPELSLKLVNHLHSSVQHNLILDAGLAPESPAAEVLERILNCEAQARAVRETVLAHRLLDAAKNSSRLAVIGLERTLEALQKGQVRVLLARDGYAKMGRRCPQCGKLSIAWTKCADCGRGTEIVFNLVGEMIARALESGCEVFRIQHETPLDNVGRIGAELTCDPPEGASRAGAVPEREAKPFLAVRDAQ